MKKCPYRTITRYERKVIRNIKNEEGVYEKKSTIEPCAQGGAHTVMTDFQECLGNECMCFNVGGQPGCRTCN